MSEVYIDCYQCKGTGKVKHECNGRELENLYMHFDCKSDFGSSESLGVYRCKACGQVWKIRYQCDQGTGSDDIWLSPGETYKGYKFTLEEAEKWGGESDTSE